MEIKKTGTLYIYVKFLVQPVHKLQINKPLKMAFCLKIKNYLLFYTIIPRKISKGNHRDFSSIP